MKANSIFMRRMSFFILLVLCASLVPTPAQAANGSFAWAKSMGGLDSDYGADIQVDAAANVYTIGFFEGTVDFDPTHGVYNLTSSGLRDIFIFKLDSNGNFLWARRIGGPGYETGNSLALDTAGNVYTTGVFEGTVDFDPGPGTYNLTSAGLRDIFIFKLDSNGSFVWARRMGGLVYDWGNAIALDTVGNVYTTGVFEGTADFDPGSNTYTLTSAGLSDIFVSKLASNGDFVWAKSIGGVSWDRGHGLAVDTNGSVYTTGSFEGTVDFDPGPGIFNLNGQGSASFISKLDNNGSFVWARSIVGGVHTNDLVVDTASNVHTTGGFIGTIDFDPGSGINNLTSTGSHDIFIAKLDSYGDFIWAKSIGGPGYAYDIGYGIAVDTSGNVYTTGSFGSTIDFDPGSNAYTLTSKGSFDIFVSKLDNSGNFLWARSMGGSDADQSSSLTVDASSNVYTTGFFYGTADFDPGTGTNHYLAAAGDRDGFITKLQEGAIFEDVPLGYWALDYIEQLYGVGITGGCATSPLRYCPEDTVTRAQMAVFLLRGIHGADYVPPEVAGTTGFADVPADHWAAAFIKQLAAEGITSGCGGGNFCPENPVTRAQMAVFLLRSKYGASYHPPAVGSSTGFTDVPADYWAAAFIKQLVAEGITVGCGGGNYCPEQPVIRAQMAVFLVRTFNLP